MLFQSTHPQGVRRRIIQITQINSIFQSTHPQGVRLLLYAIFNNATKISIHAPTRGATYSAQLYQASRIFQSTHPQGVRHNAAVAENKRLDISIHAPTRGATHNYLRQPSCKKHFNPRTHKGCDLTKSFFIALTAFQSTHPQGVRPSKIIDNIYNTLISIHAPTRGATPYVAISPMYWTISIHAPTRGATLMRLRLAFKTQFQSTHPQGVRL